MFRNVLIVSAFLSALPIVTTPAFAQAKGKCTKPQAVCALQHGGRCNPKTGAWGIGGRYGGSRNGYLDCLSKIYANKK
jgi:hypothetical protein